MKNVPRFPYEPYPWQEYIIEELKKGERKGILLESPTGSGKTAAVLYAVIEKFPDRKIVFLTRTNSQVENVLREAHNIGIEKVMTFFGRGEMCLFRTEAPDMVQGTPEEQSNYCRILVERNNRGLGGCPYRTDGPNGWPQGIMSQQDFIELGKAMICPYYAQKNLAKDAKIIATSYSFFLNPFIRERFLTWMEEELENIIIIADEAHNIPDLTRNLMSLKLSHSSINNCRKEVEQFGDLPLNNVNTSFILDSLEEAIDSLLDEGDRIITQSEVSEAYMKAFEMNSNDVKNLLNLLASYGLSIREQRENEGKLPRSHILNTAITSLAMMEGTEEYSVVISHTDEPSSLVLMNLETYKLLDFFNRTYRSYFMSGTLTPFGKFIDEVGLNDPYEVVVRADYLEKNLRVFFVNDVTSKFTMKDEVLERMRWYVKDLVEKVPRNKIVFCMSYEQLSSFLDMEIRGKIYFERKGMGNEEFQRLISDFRSKGGNLFAVINGRLSEGIDLPGKIVELAVLAGIPYPPPSPETSALELFYEMKFKRGWEYAYEAVASTRMRQAIGRIIRGPKDRGAAVILDSRARKFKGSFPNLYLTDDPVNDVNTFLAQ
ncbi:MAG: ATP-dependent DNA helicase [Thermoplasmatales archaeon]